MSSSIVPANQRGVNRFAPRMALGVAETAALLGVSRTTVHALLRSGRLRSVKIGARRLIPVAEVERLLEQGTAEE